MNRNFLYNLQESDYPMSYADRVRMMREPSYPLQGGDYMWGMGRANTTPMDGSSNLIWNSRRPMNIGTSVSEPPITLKGQISGYGTPQFKPPSYKPIGQILEGSVSKEAAPEIAEALDTIYPKEQSKSIMDAINKGKVSEGWKLSPITGDVYDTIRGGYRMTHGSPLGGGAQMLLGLAGLGTLGAGGLIKSGGKLGLKLAGKSAPRVLSFADVFAKDIAKQSPRFAKEYRKFKRGLDKADRLVHNKKLRWGNRLFFDFPEYFKGTSSLEDSPAIKDTNNIWDANSYSTFLDNPNIDPVEQDYNQFGDLPSLPNDYSDNDTSYQSWLANNVPPNQDLNYGEDEYDGYSKEDFAGALKGLGYTDDAINDALNGNYNGIQELKSNIEAYNKMVPPERQIKIIEPKEETNTQLTLANQPQEEDNSWDGTLSTDGALVGGIEENEDPNIDDLEYAQVLADIDDIIGDTDREYQPYIGGLSDYLKNYDKLWRNYLGLKRYYAGLSNVSGDRVFNEVPSGLDPRDIEATRLDLYKKYADEKLALANQERQLRGNVDLARALGYPARSAFASKDMLDAFSKAKLAESKIKATEAIAQLKADNDTKIAEMNNRRALQVAEMNNMNAMQRVQYQQNEANYRKSLDIQQKKLDRDLKRATQMGNWSEARKLKVYQEQNANKRSALNAISNYLATGNTMNGLSIYDAVSIIGGDVSKLMQNLKRSDAGNTTSDEEIARKIKDNE